MKKRTNAYVSSRGSEYKKTWLETTPAPSGHHSTHCIYLTRQALGIHGKIKKKYTLTHARQSTLPAVCSLSWVLRCRVYIICMCVYVCVCCVVFVPSLVALKISRNLKPFFFFVDKTVCYYCTRFIYIIMSSYGNDNAREQITPRVQHTSICRENMNIYLYKERETYSETS